MRQIEKLETLGLSLVSVAMVSGGLAWMAGWFAVEMTTPDPSVLGRDVPPPTVVFAPPPKVKVTTLSPTGKT